MFALLFLVPDIFMAGYLRNLQTGATVYNFGHSYVVPGLLLMIAYALGQSSIYAVLLIWIAHVGFDRAIG